MLSFFICPPFQAVYDPSTDCVTFAVVPWDYNEKPSIYNKVNNEFLKACGINPVFFERAVNEALEVTDNELIYNGTYWDDGRYPYKMKWKCTPGYRQYLFNWKVDK